MKSKIKKQTENKQCIESKELSKANKFKDEKAITLIALVITIIVLLILAAISIGAIFGENGLLAKAQLAGFATEMKQIEENVRLKRAEIQANNASGEGSTELFSTKLNENDVTIPDTLKQEVLYTRDGMQDLTSPKDYEVDDFNNLLDAEGNVANIYIIDKETGNGKENTYVYDETTDTVYKIPQTNIGGQVYHSYECAEKGKGGKSSGEGTSTGGDSSEGTISKESDVVKVENEYYYAPNLKGFNSAHTSVVYYSSDFSQTKEVSAQEYIDGGEQYQIEEGAYIFHNYGETVKRWANVKTDANGKEAWWIWIPRYAYKIDNPGTSSLTMNIIYIDVNDKPLNKERDGEELPEGYELHPAFNQGGKKLKGIWISKYEASFQYLEQSQNNNVQAPDMTGFDEENTYIEIYDKASNSYQGGADEIKLKDAKSKLNQINNNVDKPWYDYTNKIWANVKTNANGKEAWWVWIPRYAYKITDYAPEGTISEIIYLGMDDKPIDKEKYGEELPTGYIVHPAFNQGGKKLKGIWMSKYEASFQYLEQSQNNNVQAPDMTGFDEENTYIEIYDKSSRNIPRRSR